MRIVCISFIFIQPRFFWTTAIDNSKYRNYTYCSNIEILVLRMVWCKIANDTDFVFAELCDHLKKKP